MVRNKYSKEFIKWLAKYAPKHSMNQLIKKTGIEKTKLEKLLWRNNIKHKDYKARKAHANNELPVGTEYIKPDGMVLVKTGKNKWEYKQRHIYEKYHNIKLPTNVMVIFLDGDRNNFNIDNLRAVSTAVYNTAKNKHLISKNKDVNNTALTLAELYQEIKQND